MIAKIKARFDNIKKTIIYKWDTRWWNPNNEETWPTYYIKKFCTNGYFLKPTRRFYIGHVNNFYEASTINLRPFIAVTAWNLWWKDKFRIPRFEYSPQFTICFFGKWIISWYWTFPESLIEQYPDEKFNKDQYWEQMLWTYFYADGDIQKAEKTWPWRNIEEKTSTWNPKYLKAKIFVNVI